MRPAGLRVLLSAFACSPAEGSESGVGWRWALEVARLGHQVTVVTRRLYRADIEAVPRESFSGLDIQFVYVDLAPWITFHGWRKVAGYLYLYLWQLHALIVSRRLHRQKPFDFVHHITFGGIRFPTFLGALGVPLIFGPLGGGERAPLRLRASYPLRGKIVDALRDLSNFAVRLDPMMHYAFGRATHIVLRTPESVSVVPPRYRHKVFLERDIGIDPGEWGDVTTKAPSGHYPRFLFAGRHVYWKGMHLGIAAFAKVLEECPKARLTILGSGPDSGHWRRTARRLGIDGSIDWNPWVGHHDMGAVYRSHDIFLFPSLHDTGGTVLCEAAAHRLPVVCLNLGGPAVLVEETFGIKVTVDQRSETEVIAALSAALVRLARDPPEIARMGAAAGTWAAAQTWASRVERVYSIAIGRHAPTDPIQFRHPQAIHHSGEL